MLRKLVLLSVFALSSTTHATQVENFVLLDHLGDAHELYYHRNAPAVVLMVHNNQCAASQPDMAKFEALQSRHTESIFFFINSTLQDQRADIANSARHNEIKTPILDDETQIIGEALDLTQSGEVLVIDPKTWTINYRGAVTGLGAALEATLADLPIPAAQPTSAGCPIAFPHQNEGAQVSYSEDVAPLLQSKCVVCHTEGGLGPWAMSDYNMVRGFAPMIREVLRTKRMPPWHADPHIGVWKNDASLSASELQTLVHWIEAGAQRGDGPDPLLQAHSVALQWPLGQPDLIVDIPAYTVPASGVVDYQFPTVKNPLDTGVWIKGATVVPGDREVVHHILAGTLDADTTQLNRDGGIFDNYLIGYAPGNESHTFPQGTGVYVEPGGEFLFQLHYTSVGRETEDRSKIGLYFHKQTPDNFYRQDVVVNPMIKVPAHEARHAEVAYYEFNKDAILHDLLPHAHYRGVASKFELRRPDGSKETLLSVPNYDFNWQRTYEFVEPKKIVAGSRLVHTTWYDNSAANPANPDAAREVPWGLQSWDEMLYGAFSYTYVDETTEAPIHDRMLARTTQFVGFLDQNIDGKLSWRELPRRVKKQLVQGFKAVDTNGDGGLDIAEMHKITLRQQEASDKRQQENQDDESGDKKEPGSRPSSGTEAG